MMHSVVDFLGPLSTLLKRGDMAYKGYMANGKTFLYAKVLKDNNERIRELILEKSHLLPIDYQPCAIDLAAHIDIWHVLWENLDKKKAHALTDEFVFENSATFPRESVATLVELYLDLKKNT